MKKITSMCLSLLILLAAFSSFAVSSGAASLTVISNTSPVITGEVSSAIVLANYSVVFDGDLEPTADVEWYRDGALLNEGLVVFEQTGVHRLTAKSGNKEKTIYCVINESLDEEFVLFEADFTDFSSIKQLESEGFSFLNAADRYSLDENGLVLGSISDDYARVILPEWLGDFGDYSITAEAKMLTAKDSGRWFGLVYRIQNENKAYYPYYHMCVRKDTTAASGIEFAERTAANAWNVVTKTSGTVSSLTDGYHTFNVTAFGTEIRYNIDDTAVMHIDDSAIINTGIYSKGMIGLTMNFGTVAVRNIKVTVQKSAPSAPEEQKPKHPLNLINPIANVQKVSGSDSDKVLSGENSPAGAWLKVSELKDVSKTVKTCMDNNVVPTFLINSTDEANAVLNAMKENGSNDANFVSEKADALEHVRLNMSTARTGLIVDLKNSELTSKEAHEIRVAVRSAPATFCVVKSKNASKKAVMELQGLAVAVWVEVEAEVGTPEYTVEVMKAVTSGANGVISKSAAELAKTVNEYLKENAMTRTPLMIGHRGNPSQAPENSLKGMLTAYENGADVIEIDVYLTKDGKSIIVHNNTLNATTNYTGYQTVSNMTLAEIRNYRLKDKDGRVTTEVVPTLDEILEAFKDKDCRIFVEFKASGNDNVTAAMELIKSYGMEDRVDVISFDSSYLAQTRRDIKGMSTGFLHYPKGNAATIENALSAFLTSLPDAQMSFSTLNPNNSIMTNHFAQVATDRGMTVWPWTYNLATNNQGFLSGCDGVTTDDVQWVKDMAKYLTSADDGKTVAVGESFSPSAAFVTYGGAETKISGEKMSVQVISGGDCLEYKDLQLVGKKNGTASVIYGYNFTTADGSGYVLYTQPVTVTVGVEEVVDDDEDNGLPTSAIIAIIVIAVALVGGVVAIVILLKKKK